MNWPAALVAAAVVAGYVCLGVINRPVEVYVWARDVSVCASVEAPATLFAQDVGDDE